MEKFIIYSDSYAYNWWLVRIRRLPKEGIGRWRRASKGSNCTREEQLLSQDTTQVWRENENDTPLVWLLLKRDDRQIEVKIPDFPIQGGPVHTQKAGSLGFVAPAFCQRF